jgi:hypothetical protein
VAGFVRKAKASTGDGEYTPAPSGNHVAVCIAFIDLGTQRRKKYQSEAYEETEMIFLCWELTDVAGRPVVGRDFRASLHTKSHLRQWVKNWRGKDLGEEEEFDLTKLVGKKCVLTIEHKRSGDRTFATVSNLMAPIKGLAVPDPERTPYCWTRMDGTPFRGPDWLPWLYGKSIEEWVADCLEAKAVGVEASGEADPDGDVDDFAAQPGAGDLEDAPF